MESMRTRFKAMKSTTDDIGEKHLRVAERCRSIEGLHCPYSTPFAIPHFCDRRTNLRTVVHVDKTKKVTVLQILEEKSTRAPFNRTTKTQTRKTSTNTLEHTKMSFHQLRFAFRHDRHGGSSLTVRRPEVEHSLFNDNLETEKPAPDSSCAIARLLPIIFVGVEDW
jgi:hypothetical protein